MLPLSDKKRNITSEYRWWNSVKKNKCDVDVIVTQQDYVSILLICIAKVFIRDRKSASRTLFSFSVNSEGKGEFQHNAGAHVWRLFSLFRLVFGWKEFWTFKPFAELSADLRARLRRLVFVWDRRRETDSAAAKIKAGHLQNTLGRRFNAQCQGSGIAEEHGQRQNYPITQYNTA